MDTSAPRQGAFRAVGIERISYSVPDTFFPLQDAPAPATTTNSSKPSTQKWSNHFQGPRARTQLRAWSRVQLPSQSTRNFSGTVMKRVGLPIPRAMKASTIPTPAAPRRIEKPMIAEDGMPTRRVARRLDSYEVSDEECQMKGLPLSKLEMTGLQMQAKADVAHCLKTFPTSTTQNEARQRRAGHYVQTVPLKRRTETVTGTGNRLTTYTDALELPKVTPQFRVPSRRFSVLPRQQASSPTLSPIALFTPDQEPVTPAAVMEPPRCMSDAKSPTKRSPRHKSPPVKNDGPRISEPAVKLLPATTPKIEPSPTKPASPPPATPLGESRSLRNAAVTPSTFPKAAPFGTAFADMQRLSAIRPGTMPLRLSPTKLAATPCPTYRIIEAAEPQSPTKKKSSAAGTPTKSDATPATPRIFTNISYMTADVPSPVAFVSTLFPDSPVKQPAELQSGTPQKPTSFDFGTTSPAFNSVTWLNNAEETTRPVASLKKGGRRQSEPLVRNCLKTQNRRQTISPQKLVFQADQTFTGSDGLFSPVKKVAPPKISPSELMSSVPLLPKPQKSQESPDSKQSPVARQGTNEVMNIDMRQNPDIFGTKAVSLSLSPVIGAALPSIAENCSEIESADEAAKLQLFSPSVTVQSRRDVEENADQPPTEPEEIGAKETSVSPVVDTSVGGLGIFESLPAPNSPLLSIEEQEEVVNTDLHIVKQSPSPVTSAPTSTVPNEQKLSPSPTLNLSFTPVNTRSPSAVEASLQKQESIPESPPTITTEIVETVTAQSHDYDSPGRDYMREFIRRSRPKRPSTTEAGSPVGPTVKRQPLGPKSPNTESPSKSKRKHEKGHDQHESPLKKVSSSSPKKMRRYGKTSSKRDATNENEEQTGTPEVKVVTESVANVDDDEDNESDGASRRSSRLRNQTRPPSVKSAIPTPIKIGRNSGPTLNSAVRSEQQDLTNQTRMNTRKNKGNSEYPAQFLARQSEEAQSEPEPVERESSSEKEGRKCVNWSNPLAMYQENIQDQEKEKPKKAKTSKPKSVRMSGIAKPVTRAKTTADKERTARLAEHFGMVSNGTPAKPQRSTRSRMRI